MIFENQVLTLIDLDPLIINIFIFSAFDQKRTINCNFVHWIAKQKAQRHKGINKMTERISNVLAFLFDNIFQAASLYSCMHFDK